MHVYREVFVIIFDVTRKHWSCLHQRDNHMYSHVKPCKAIASITIFSLSFLFFLLFFFFFFLPSLFFIFLFSVFLSFLLIFSVFFLFQTSFLASPFAPFLRCKKTRLKEKHTRLNMTDDVVVLKACD